MPVLFVGHGSPMNIIDRNIFTETFQRLGRDLPRPSAIVCVSAHWITAQTQVLSSAKPRQIYDFYGFPEELYKIKYEPLGAPTIARSAGPPATEEWGLDHGAWSVLHHMYPDANIPTFQLSLSSQLKPLEHLQMAQTLRKLKSDNVLILASGNLVHNLRRIEWDANAKPNAWAEEFEDFVINTLTKQNFSQSEMVEQIFSSSLLNLAHPSVEHLIPLIYALGASNEGQKPKIEVRGIQNASISMAAIRFE